MTECGDGLVGPGSHGWVAAPRIAPPVPTLDQVLAPALSAVPHAEALVVRRADGTTSRWTYRELDADVAARAAALAAAGIGPGDFVVLVASRVPELVPTVLALLRLGAAYVPVDPAAPDVHWGTVAAAVKARALIGPATALARAASVVGPGTLLLDVAAALPPAASGTSAVLVDEAATAYVLFTSGSAGTPKGVVVSHGNVAYRLPSYLALSAGPCRYLLHSSLCFDGSVGGMFSTLVRGGCLVLVSDAAAGDPGLVADTIRAERITHLEPVPSWYATLLDVAPAADLASVRVVILGGEVLPPELVATAGRLLPHARLFNDYGPTEVTVAATVFEVPPGWPAQEVPIGRPHANTAVAVLDGRQRPVPDGEVGELWVRGPCVAQGYLGTPGHPAFRIDPDTGERSYRTGDLARWDGDGLLRFCGRLDRQVKIRGQRVEPEEVESVLSGLPGVAGAAVEVDAAGPEPRLVAYVTGRPAAGLTDDGVAGQLAERLPAHLRPAVVVVLPALPLTAGGKVDRTALPPAPRATGGGHAAAAPRNPVERAVVAAFAAVLDLDADRETDFFAAGGQSLGAARVVARLRRDLGIDAGLADLAAHPTAAALADALRDRAPAAAGQPLSRRPRPREEPWRVPAFPRQESFWYLEYLPGNAGRSNLVELLFFPPGTGPALLRRAVEQLVERHAALRTGFELNPDGLQQVIRPHARPEVSELPPVADEAELDERADGFGARPFDLGTAPLLRAGITHGPAGPVLVLVVHHAVADGWSLNLLTEELVAFVRAGGGDAGLPEPAVEYADLVEWTAQRPPARRAAAVEHVTPILHQGAESADRMLPFDRPRPSQPDPRAGVVTRALPGATLERAAEMARRSGTTVYSVLAASFGALLAQSSGQQQVVLTGPLSGRGDPALDRVVGCCINTRLIPVDVSGGPTFVELVRRVAGQAAAAETHEWLPLEVAVRDLSEGVRTRFGPVLLNLLEPQAGDLSIGEGSVRRRDRPSAMAYSELDVYLEPNGNGLGVQGVYALQRLDGDTVAALLDRWVGLLERALDDPEQRVSALPLVTAGEQTRLEAFEGDPGAPPVSTVLDRVRATTGEQPGAPAAVDADGAWTRAEVWDRAGAIAALLAARGIGRGARVVLALDETVDAVAALVGCWRAGVVPVPVGEGQPEARVAAIAATADAGLVLDRSVLQTVPAVAPWADVPLAPETPAYVLFTSGSTGEPKGVVVSHAALAASTEARLAVYPRRPQVALLTHDLAFDAALGIVVWYLATGGTLVLPRHDHRLDPDWLAGLIRRHRVGQLDIIPSHYRLLLDLAAPADLASLELVTLGAEACPPSLVRAHRHLLPGTVLVNEYGPTESTVWALAHFCADADAAAERVPIGTPIRGVTARVVNALGQRVPPGTDGELLLGGHLLAEGYLDDPVRTAERFVHLDGRRWYRTGDRARWTAAGELVFLGRLDTQLKVRGFRIEPEEVESALGRLDGVVRAAVDAREMVPGEPLLVGWVQLSPEVTGNDTDLTARLRQRLLGQLPEWLVPSVLQIVDEMPETTTGKVDRGRLPDPHALPLLGGSPPATATEQHLAAIWSDLLRRPVPADRSFFALGGQSLLAARMVARVRIELDTDIELRDVLAASRIRDIAAAIDGKRDRGLPAPQPGPAGPAGGEELELSEVEELLARVEDLSDGEVADLLARLGEQ